jgi:hypothetical protein
MKKVAGTLILLLVSEVSFAEVFKCTGSLTRTRTDGASEEQIGPKPNSNHYELEISNWEKNSIRFVQFIEGKRYSGDIPAKVANGVYQTDHTMKKGNVISTAQIQFDVHSKKALILYTLTRGKVSIRSEFDGY